MGIYLPNMEMPKGKRGKRIIIFPNGAVIELIAEHIYDGDLHTVKAVPVPPHGRLIDADALYEGVPTSWAGDKQDRFCAITGEQIKAAPTIIPAEPLNEEVNE